MRKEIVKNNKYDNAVFTENSIKEYNLYCDKLLDNFTKELKNRDNSKEISIIDVKEAYRRINKKIYRDDTFIIIVICNKILFFITTLFISEIYERIKNKEPLPLIIFVLFLFFLFLTIFFIYKEYKSEY